MSRSRDLRARVVYTGLSYSKQCVPPHRALLHRPMFDQRGHEQRRHRRPAVP